jgi:hypothetical protein
VKIRKYIGYWAASARIPKLEWRFPPTNRPIISCYLLVKYISYLPNCCNNQLKIVDGRWQTCCNDQWKLDGDDGLEFYYGGNLFNRVKSMLFLNKFPPRNVQDLCCQIGDDGVEF